MNFEITVVFLEEEISYLENLYNHNTINDSFYSNKHKEDIEKKIYNFRKAKEKLKNES